MDGPLPLLSCETGPSNSCGSLEALVASCFYFTVAFSQEHVMYVKIFTAWLLTGLKPFPRKNPVMCKEERKSWCNSLKTFQTASFKYWVSMYQSTRSPKL